MSRERDPARTLKPTHRSRVGTRMRHATSAVVLLLWFTLAPATAKKAPPIGVADLVGCYEAPPGDDNFNLMKFDAAGRFWYLDTSIGKPAQTKFQLRDRSLTISWAGGPDQTLIIGAIDGGGIHFGGGGTWKRIDCKRFQDHVRP
jgi:hypothetical protein